MPTIVKRVIIKLISIVFTSLIGVLAFGIRFVPQQKRFEAFKKYGMHLLSVHYYMPVPDDADLQTSRYTTQMVGVTIDDQTALAFLTDVVDAHKPEFAQFPVQASNEPNGFYLLNGSYMAIDGNVYYGIVRHLKPKRIVEIGSGYSTALARQAINKNVADGAEATQLICVEPFPTEVLLNVDSIKPIQKRVQDVDLAVFEELSAGDILFIDSSHMLRLGSDVWWEFAEILPRLKAGVYVHVHDISLPKPYPPVYAEKFLFWNEQYVLQTFLAFNNRFEVVWPGNYMLINHRERLMQSFQPEYDHMRAKFPQSEATSFWMRVKDNNSPEEIS